MNYYPTLSANVENALYRCGNDRVMHNDGKPASMAIRQTAIIDDPSDKYMVETGETHDEAGRKVAKRFAEYLRKRGESLEAWADKIEEALERKAGER
jgi:hypothetical protein